MKTKKLSVRLLAWLAAALLFFGLQCLPQSPKRYPVTREARSAFPVVDQLIESNRLKEAGTKLKELVRSGGENYKTLYYEALILFKENKFTESLGVLEKSFATQKYDPDLYMLAGFNWVALNRTEHARPFYVAASQLAPDDYMIHYHMGRLNYTDQDFALAEKEFRKALELNPAYAKGYDNLGLALEALGREEETVQAYRKAIELDQQQDLKNEWPCVNLARFLFKKNRFKESLEWARKASEINAHSTDAFLSLAEALNKLGRDREAVEALKVSVQNNPEYSRPHYLLGQIYRRQGLLEDAQKELQVFQELNRKEKEKKRGRS